MYENELTQANGSVKTMSTVAAYSTGTVIYNAQLGGSSLALQKVAQDSLASHRNSHR